VTRPNRPTPRTGVAELFGCADGYAGIQLLRCTEQGGRHLDRGEVAPAVDHVAFQRECGTEYTALDARLEGPADVENRIAPLRTPSRSGAEGLGVPWVHPRSGRLRGAAVRQGCWAASSA
jgi:hypothetical protein